MLVPSRTTVPELEKLSRQSGTTVDVLTVNREERRFLLDAGDGAALTGHDLDVAPQAAGANPVVRITMDELALVYYSTGRLPDRDVYPALPIVGATEQRLSCDELGVDLSRAETIRWYARQQGALPYTSHEAATQHGINAAVGTGTALFIVAMIIGGGGSGGGSSSPSADEHNYADYQAYRWAVTAADRRILGLLGLKRERACAAQQLRTGDETDLAILGQIEESQRALAAKSTSDRDQRDLQTRLLDQFDPLLASTEQADFAGATQVYREAEWFANADATQSLSKFMQGTVWLGRITLTDQQLVFRPRSKVGAAAGTEVRIAYADLATIEVSKHMRWCGVVVTQRNGHKDSFTVLHGMWGDSDATEAAAG